MINSKLFIKLFPIEGNNIFVIAFLVLTEPPHFILKFFRNKKLNYLLCYVGTSILFIVWGFYLLLLSDRSWSLFLWSNRFLNLWSCFVFVFLFELSGLFFLMKDLVKKVILIILVMVGRVPLLNGRAEIVTNEVLERMLIDFHLYLFCK